MVRYSAALICVCSIVFSSNCRALEVLATWQKFATPAGAFSTTQYGQNGSNSYFSNLEMTFQNMVAADNATSSDPSFDSLQGTADGNPSNATGQWIQLNFGKAASFSGYSFEITDIVIRFWNNSGDPGNSSSEVHFFSNVGGFNFKPTSPQMNSNGTGILSSRTAAPPAGTQNYVDNAATAGGTMQHNIITAGASSLQIRMAPDRMSGFDPHWAMASFASATINSQTFTLPPDSVIAVFGTATAPVPEPGTYLLGTVCVCTAGVIQYRRRKNAKAARDA